MRRGVGCGEAVDEVGVGGGHGEVGNAGEDEEEHTRGGAGLFFLFVFVIFFICELGGGKRGTGGGQKGKEGAAVASASAAAVSAKKTRHRGDVFGLLFLSFSRVIFFLSKKNRKFIFNFVFVRNLFFLTHLMRRVLWPNERDRDAEKGDPPAGGALARGGRGRRRRERVFDVASPSLSLSLSDFFCRLRRSQPWPGEQRLRRQRVFLGVGGRESPAGLRDREAERNGGPERERGVDKRSRRR